ncbi:MAG: hypothetical protein QOD42_2608 [Sphingomonadales bacterium]|jgi:uncharacterized membrane protein YhaH (DUF805 family)|nr:hypothetical protein [Sphingomonadales bacterium]
MKYAKYALVYGLLVGLVIGATLVSIVAFAARSPILTSVWFGYLVMLVAMIFIFVGVKRYRDIERGGVIGFVPALAMGLATALVAAIAYVLIWEAYLAATHYAFVDKYFRGPEMAEMRAQYLNPLLRMPQTFLEIAPAGLVVALVSAGLLRDPRVFPARPRT